MFTSKPRAVDTSMFSRSAIFDLSIPDRANSLKKSISSPLNRFLKAGQNPLHHWGRGHNSIRWWLQLRTCFAERWDRLFPLSPAKYQTRNSIYFSKVMQIKQHFLSYSGTFIYFVSKELYWSLMAAITILLIHVMSPFPK